MSITETMRTVDVVALDMDPPVIVDPTTPVRDVLERMRRGEAGSAMVCHEGRLRGIFTEYDIRNKVVGVAGALGQPVCSLMTPDPVCVAENDTIAKAMMAMYRGGFRHVPVLDAQGQVVGCVRHKDIIHFLIELFAQQVLNQPPHSRYVPKVPNGGT